MLGALLTLQLGPASTSATPASQPSHSTIRASEQGDVVITPANATEGTVVVPRLRITGSGTSHSSGEHDLTIAYDAEAGAYNIMSSAPIRINGAEAVSNDRVVQLFNRLHDKTKRVIDGSTTALSEGGQPSLALSTQDIPVVAYQTPSGAVGLLVCQSKACPLSSAITRILDAGGSQFPSLALTSADIPIVAYYRVSSADLQLALCSDATCSTPPTIRTLDSNGDVGEYCSLAINSLGRAVVAYRDATNSQTKIAVCADATCTSTTGRNIGAGGIDNSLAITSTDIPVVSYLETGGNFDLKFGMCVDTTCTGTPVARAVDTDGDVGQFPSLVLTSTDQPRISYYDSSSARLKVAICSDTSCSAFPTLIAIDPTFITQVVVGKYTSAALDKNSTLVISYYDQTNTALKFVHCGDEACSNPTIRTLDSAGSVGSFTSLALDKSDNPVVLYFNSVTGANSNLKMIRCADPTCI